MIIGYTFELYTFTCSKKNQVFFEWWFVDIRFSLLLLFSYGCILCESFKSEWILILCYPLMNKNESAIVIVNSGGSISNTNWLVDNHLNCLIPIVPGSIKPAVFLHRVFPVHSYLEIGFNFNIVQWLIF